MVHRPYVDDICNSFSPFPIVCSIQERRPDEAVAEVQLFAAPIEQGMEHPVGLRHPIYISCVKRVSSFAAGHLASLPA